MDVDDPKVNLEGQGHRSEVKVTSLKNGTLGIISLYMVHLVYTAEPLQHMECCRLSITEIQPTLHVHSRYTAGALQFKLGPYKGR